MIAGLNLSNQDVVDDFKCCCCEMETPGRRMNAGWLFTTLIGQNIYSEQLMS